MAQFTVEKPRTLCAPGLHTFTLVEVTPVQMPSFDGAGEVERLVWRFVSDKKDEEGLQYECPVFTGHVYGNARARLTWLLDMLRPGMSKAQATNTASDEFIGHRYEGMVKHGASIKDPDKKIAEIQYLRPVDDPADFFANADGETPAGCEVCGQALSNAELLACDTRWRGEKRYCSMHAREKLAQERIEAAEAEDLFSAA